jgi:Zn-dependent protease
LKKTLQGGEKKARPRRSFAHRHNGSARPAQHESSTFMFRSFQVGRAFGIPVFVHPTFLLLPLWVLYNTRGTGPVGMLFGLATLLAIFGCVVLHELGHALMARVFGIGTRDITLYPIGGVARLERMSERPVEEVLIALAGPAVNFVLFVLLTPLFLAAALSGLLGGDLVGLTAEQGLLPLAAKFAATLWLGNLILLVFNLLPAFPMDGGRVLRALLAMGLGHLRATEIAAAVGLGVAVLIGALTFVFGNPMLVVLAVFVCFMGQIELLAVRRREAMRQVSVLRQRPAVVIDHVRPAEPVGLDVPPAPPRAPDFTGCVWDAARGVWVLWHNGRPVRVFGTQPE